MIGIIGGSGFDSFLKSPSRVVIKTPFGVSTVFLGSVDSKEVLFIPRHGRGHSKMPSEINYRSNIYSAFMKDVEKIYATNAVGTSNTNIPPGTFVILDQILDLTYGRESTYFTGDDFKVTTKSGKVLSGVVHTDVSEPFNKQVRQELIGACRKFNKNPVEEGTVAVFNGPRYETPAEIKAYTKLGANYFGMTSSPEAFLAKELEIPYATLAVVTNYAAGFQSSITHNEVNELFKARISDVKQILNYAILNF